MNDVNTSSRYSKRFYFSVFWAGIAILVTIFYAVYQNNYAPLLVVSSLSPLLLLIIQKLDLFSQRSLRDNSYLKEKAFKLLNSSEKSYKEIKAVRFRTRVISARNNRVLGTINKLSQTVEDSLPDRDSTISQEEVRTNDLDSFGSQEIDINSTQALRNEWQEFLDQYSRLSHFNSTSNSTLTAVQQAEISRILEGFGISNVVLLDMEPLTPFDRPLKQSECINWDDFLHCVAEALEPFVVIMSFQTLQSLSNSDREELNYLDAAYIVPQPLTTEELSAHGFSRIPANAEFSTVELICPTEFIHRV